MAENAFRASSIYVNLVAQTSKFEKGMRGARKEVGLISKSIKALGISFAGVFSLRAAAGTIGGAMRSIDELAKTSRKLGIATENLAGMRLAAEETGVDIRKLEMGLQRMVRRVSEAAIGTGEAQGALKELGVDAAALNQLSPDEQFRELAKAMQGVEKQSDRVRLAFKLFDSEGVALVNTLNLGTIGLDNMAQKARDLGLAITNDVAKSVEEANDRITEMKAAFAGLKLQLGIAAAPTAGGMAESIQGMRRVGVGQSITSTVGALFLRLAGGSRSSMGRFLMRQDAFRPGGTFDPSPGGRSTGAISSNRHLTETARIWADEQIARVKAARKRDADLAANPPVAPGLLPDPYGIMRELLGGMGRGIRQRLTGNLPNVRRAMSQQSYLQRLQGGEFGAMAPQEQPGFRSLSALEVGTSAAFSQRVRSSQQRNLEKVQEKQLKEQSETRKAVQGILEQVKSGIALGVANLQGAF